MSSISPSSQFSPLSPETEMTYRTDTREHEFQVVDFSWLKTLRKFSRHKTQINEAITIGLSKIENDFEQKELEIGTTTVNKMLVTTHDGCLYGTVKNNEVDGSDTFSCSFARYLKDTDEQPIQTGTGNNRNIISYQNGFFVVLQFGTYRRVLHLFSGSKKDIFMCLDDGEMFTIDRDEEVCAWPLPRELYFRTCILKMQPVQRATVYDMERLACGIRIEHEAVIIRFDGSTAIIKQSY